MTILDMLKTMTLPSLPIAKNDGLEKNYLNFFGPSFYHTMRNITLFYKKKAISDGMILVNGKTSFENYLIKNGDILNHKTIRKELPVYKGELTKIFENDDLLVINKPPSIPVHSCGGYFFNTVIKIVEFEFGIPNIHGDFISCSST